MKVQDKMEEYQQEIYELELDLTDDEQPLEERESIRKRINELHDWLCYFNNTETNN